MKRKGTKHKGGFLSLYLTSLLVSSLSLIFVAVISSLIINMLKNPLGATDVGSLLVLLLSAALSGLVISRLGGDGKLLSVLLSSLSVSALLMLIGLILSEGAVGGRVILNYLCYIAIAVFAAYLGTFKKKGKRRHG